MLAYMVFFFAVNTNFKGLKCTDNLQQVLFQYKRCPCHEYFPSFVWHHNHNGQLWAKSWIADFAN